VAAFAFDSCVAQIRGCFAVSLPAMLDTVRISALLEPFVAPVSPELVNQLQIYLELLLRWNSRINLTAIRDPEQIVTRHFGESLFAARVLRDVGAFVPVGDALPSLADVGSGAGFPGLPIKLFVPEIHLTLIESQNKKATFLREAIRALELENVEVFCGRAEGWNRSANVVTLRAVEKFETTLPEIVRLAAPDGTIGLLASASQVSPAQRSLGSSWQIIQASRIPSSDERVVLVGKNVF
jgi:16S rRNA (guanine527-N7)-methyltransferase